jgi:hypothetical protein
MIKQPPKVKKDRSAIKTCLECGIQFLGHAISKYCPAHTKTKNRIKCVKHHIKPEFSNVIIKHKLNQISTKTLICQLCGNKFKSDMIPGQSIYPKFCEEHRNEYKRKNYKKTKGVS